MKIRVIVLDGLDWEWCNANKEFCQPLWEVADRGCHALLKSLDPPVTSSSAAALLTGKELTVPFMHNDMFATSREIIRSRPWVHELGRYEMTMGMCNVPITWPAFVMPMNSWMTSGFPLPDNCANSGAPWQNNLDEYQLQAYPINELSGIETEANETDKTLAAEAILTKWLLEYATDTDVQIVWYRATDIAGHHFWGEQKYKDAVKATCQYVTDLHEADLDCNIVVISDHGFDAIESPRCAEYLASNHGPTAIAAGMNGAHTMDGILFACGPDIHARGELPDQQLLHVAGGLFDILGIPPAPGVEVGNPEWTVPYTKDQSDAMRRQLQSLGYIK